MFIIIMLYLTCFNFVALNKEYVKLVNNKSGLTRMALS